MRAKWVLLLKIQLIGLTGINKLRKTDDVRVKRRAVGGSIVFMLLGILALAYATLLAIGFRAQGLSRLLPAMAIATSSSVVFVFTVFRGETILFSARDREMTAALPVSKAQAAAARLICAYLINFAFTLVISIPFSVIYFLDEPLTASKIFTVVTAALFSPLTPIALGTAIGTLFSAVTARLRKNGILNALFSVMLFGALMTAYFALFFSGNGAAPDMNVFYEIAVRKIYAPALLIQRSLSENESGGILSFCALNLVSAILLVIAAALLYDRICLLLQTKSKPRSLKNSAIKQSPVFISLVKKEFRKLFSSPACILNGASGNILLLLAAVLLPFFGNQILGTDAAIRQSLAFIGVALIAFATCMASPSAAALSLEGKSRDLLFSLPVSARTVLLAKAAPAFLLGTCTAIPFTISYAIVLRIGALGWIATLCAALIFPAFSGIFGIYLNSKFPRYDWTNEMQVIKNGTPTAIMIFFSLIFTFGTAFVCFRFGLWGAIGAIGLALALCVIFFKLMKKQTLFI